MDQQILSSKPTTKNRSSSYRRYKRQASIERKKHIIKSEGNYWHYDFEGVLSKGKIHCSCPMCRRKFKDEAKISDRRAIVADIDQLKDSNLGVPSKMHRVRLKRSYQSWRAPEIAKF